MARQIIDLDTPQQGGGRGDPPRAAFQKTNDNFGELYQKNADQDTAIAGKEASLGFRPVRQGGGTGMGANTVYVGWNTVGSGRLKVQVDAVSLGDMLHTSWYDPLTTNSPGWLLATTRDGLAEGATKAINGRPGIWKCTGVWLDGGTNAIFVRIS
ncbi:hypothetical protein QYG59_18035 [Xanthomonas perforans]|uniref:hypothetical protein n=1 Tax=Xanthomonas perforans TaxID=442694 RepID=UPI0032B551F5